jgi:hypothetical protein
VESRRVRLFLFLENEIYGSKDAGNGCKMIPLQSFLLKE